MLTETLNQLARDEREKYPVLFSPVKNKVREVNPDISMPFKFKVGEPSPLGLFAYSTLVQSESNVLLPNRRLLTCWAMHQRSALLGRVVFSDNSGKTLYRDIDLKGIGWIMSYNQDDLGTAIEEIGPVGERPDGGFYGLLDSTTALFDQRKSEEFVDAGIRTHRVLAIIALEELISEGRKISVTEAYDQHVIPVDFHPVIAVRAYGTKARIKDISLRSGKSEQYRRLLIEDAKRMVSQECHINLTSDEEYLRWFAKTLGTNVRLIHRLGVAHNVLTEHNITLDCRITDHDGVFPLGEQERQNDLERAEITLRNLTKYVGGAFGTSVYKEMEDFEETIREPREFWISRELIDIFRQNYEETLP